LKNCNDNDKIISYLENELNESERKNFESELVTNLELKKEYDSTIKLINSLNKLPKIKASSNFIVSLNNKIDEYEKNKNFKWIFSSISSLFTTYPKYSFASLSLVLLFALTYFMSVGSLSDSFMLSNSSNDSLYENEIADSDSLLNNKSLINE